MLVNSIISYQPKTSQDIILFQTAHFHVPKMGTDRYENTFIQFISKQWNFRTWCFLESFYITQDYYLKNAYMTLTFCKFHVSQS